MAIIDSIPGFTVQVIVNGQPAPEYDDEMVDVDTGSAHRAVNKYIEAINDQEFSIKCTLNRTFPYSENDLDIETYIDGQKLSCRTVRSAKVLAGRDENIHGHRFLLGDQWFIRKFTFSRLSITEDHTNVPGADKMRQLQQTGLISIRVHRAVFQGKARSTSHHRDKTCSTSTNLGEISEKALKGRALTHAVGLTPMQAIPRKNISQSYKIDPVDEPLLTYNFKYLSQESLKGQCIIPRSPSPTPLEERDEATLNIEELRELNRIGKQKLEAQKNVIVTRVKSEIKRVRYEYDDDIEFRGARPVKRQVSAMVDLTQD